MDSTHTLGLRVLSKLSDVTGKGIQKFHCIILQAWIGMTKAINRVHKERVSSNAANTTELKTVRNFLLHSICVSCSTPGDKNNSQSLI